MLKTPPYLEVLRIVESHILVVGVGIIDSFVTNQPYAASPYLVGQIQFLIGIRKTLESSFKGRSKRDSKVAWTELRNFLYAEAGRYTFRMGIDQLPPEYIRGYDRAQLSLLQDLETEFGIPSEQITNLDDLDLYQLQVTDSEPITVPVIPSPVDTETA